MSQEGTTDTVILESVDQNADLNLLRLSAPRSFLQRPPFGKFVMARCAQESSSAERTDWSIYLRRPLFLVDAQPIPSEPDLTSLTVHIPSGDDRGYQFLRRLNRGDTVNLLGPFGRDVAQKPDARHLLIAASPKLAPLILPAVEGMLNQNGRVTLIMHCDQVDPALLAHVPISVEIQSTADRDDWMTLLQDAIGWSDVMYIYDATLTPQGWADLLRQKRFILDDDYAQIFMPSDLLCCTGVCMACVVERANGSLTRACVHGPVFPLTDLVR